jgi:hypothetical protein
MAKPALMEVLVQLWGEERTAEANNQRAARSGWRLYAASMLSNRLRTNSFASVMIRSINSLTVGMSLMRPTTMPQLQAPAIIMGHAELAALLVRMFVGWNKRIAEAIPALCLLDKRMQRPDRGLPLLHRDKQTDRMR